MGEMGSDGLPCIRSRRCRLCGILDPLADACAVLSRLADRGALRQRMRRLLSYELDELLAAGGDDGPRRPALPAEELSLELLALLATGRARRWRCQERIRGRLGKLLCKECWWWPLGRRARLFDGSGEPDESSGGVELICHDSSRFGGQKERPRVIRRIR